MEHQELKGIDTAHSTNDKELENARVELAQQEFAREAKRLRLKARISQEELASKMGIEQGIISRIERAIYGITLDVVLNYARIFNDDPHRLADIYWGNTINEISDVNRQALEKIWEIMEVYYLPKHPQHLLNNPPQPPIEPPTEQTWKGVREGVAESRRRSNIRRKNETPTETNPDNIEK